MGKLLKLHGGEALLSVRILDNEVFLLDDPSHNFLGLFRFTVIILNRAASRVATLDLEVDNSAARLQPIVKLVDCAKSFNETLFRLVLDFKVVMGLL